MAIDIQKLVSLRSSILRGFSFQQNSNACRMQTVMRKSFLLLVLLNVLIPLPSKGRDITASADATLPPSPDDAKDADPANASLQTSYDTATAQPTAGEDPKVERNGTSPVPAQTDNRVATSATPNTQENPIETSSPEKKSNKKKKKVTINARIHALWEMTHKDVPDNPLTNENEFENKAPENQFQIRRARFKMSWRPEKWLTAVLQVGGFQDNDFGISLLRDAYIHVSPLQYLEIRVGQFKKPFSRLELRSSGKLQVLNRGEGNELLVEELRYGDRDLGLQFSGRILPTVKLDYEIGVFNGSGPDISERGTSKDVTGRIKAEPFSWLSVGVNGSLKVFDDTENVDKTAWAAGADAVLKVAGFRTHLEGILGLDHAFRNREIQVTDSAPPVFDFLAIVSYKHKIADAYTAVSLEPVFKIELLDPNTKVIDDQVLIYSPGFNIYISKYLRLMIQGEILRSAVNSRVRYPEREILAIQICFDI